MATTCLRRYQSVVIDGEQRVLHSRVGELWQLKNPKDGAISSISLPSLRKKYEEGTLQFVIKGRLSSDIAKELYKAEPRGKPAEVADEEWKLASAKMALVKGVWALSWQSDVQKKRIKELWPELTRKLKVVPLIPDASTVHRWWAKLESYGWDARALLPQNWKKGRRPELIMGELLGLVEDGVEDGYLTMERPPKEDAYKAVCILVNARNEASPHLEPLAHPTKRQVIRYIDGLDAFDVYAARYGHENAIRRFRSVQGSNIATRPLERVELDHTVLDVIVLDDATLLPLGRPTLAVAIDVFTRCVIGIYIGFEPPSGSTVGQCLKSALLPKTGLLEGINGVVNVWDVYGQMETLVLDQALENHARAIERALGCLGIEPAWCGRKMPWQKGGVERFIQTINKGFCHKIAGTTRSNIRDKDEYDAVGRAVCSFSALRHGAIKWIVDTYHVRNHRSLQMSPIGKWRSSIKEDDYPLATDLQAIEIFLSVPKPAKLTHKGVTRNNLIYNSPELADIRRRFGAELDVTAYESASDLGWITVEHVESGERIRTPCLNQEYAAGLTQWQHKSIRKHARDLGIGVATFDEQLAAKKSLEATIYEGMAASPLRERVRAARLLQQTRDPFGDAPVKSPTTSFVREEAWSSHNEFYDEFDGVETEVH